MYNDDNIEEIIDLLQYALQNKDWNAIEEALEILIGEEDIDLDD